MHQRSLFFGCSVEFHVVLDLVQPEGGQKREAVCDDDRNKDADSQNEFVLLRTAHSKFLHPAHAAVEAGGEVGAGAVKTAESDVTSKAFWLPVLLTLAPEDHRVTKHRLLVSGESKTDCQDEGEDLYDEGADHCGQEDTLLVAHHCR